MSNVMRSLVEYNGINTCPFNSDYFKQTNIDYIFCIPSQKPDIEQIVKVWVNACIDNQVVVKTPKGTSLEGQNITGHKLMVCGNMNLKIEYVACNQTQSVHTANTTFPFCGYIVLPENFNPNSVVTANVLIEDVHSEQMDLRCVYNNITMLLIADIC